MATAIGYEYDRPTPALEPVVPMLPSEAVPAWEEWLGADWFSPTLRQIHSLTRLPFGWDTYASPPITLAAMQSAVFAMVTMGLLNPELTAPQVSPVAGGGIQLEWQMFPKEIEIEALPDGSLEYLTVDGGEPIQEGTIDPVGLELTQLATWLTST